MSANPAVIITRIRPRSYNDRNRNAKSREDYRKYQELLHSEGRRVRSEPFDGALYGRVYYFQRKGGQIIDADNLSKPVLDALRRAVYRDDSQVVLRVAARINIEEGAHEFINDGIDISDYVKLFRFLATGENVLYVEIGPCETMRIRFGPL